MTHLLKFVSTIINKRLARVTVIFLLLAVLSTLSLYESSRQSATTDEVPHIPAGISYVKTGDFRLNYEIPILFKYLSGMSSEFFTNTKIDTSWPEWNNNQQWAFGRRFLYQTQENNADKIIFWARLPILLSAIGLGLIVYFWATGMFGNKIGLLALFLYTLDPNVIALSHLVTFDLPMTFFTTLSLYLVWRYRTFNNKIYLILAGAAIGFALCTKITALLMLAIISFTLIPTTDILLKKQKAIKSYIASVLIFYAAVFVTIWITYFAIMGLSAFHGAKILPGHFQKSLVESLIIFNKPQPMFLIGVLSPVAFWWYFPVTFLLKSPIVILFLLIIGLIMILFKKIKIMPSFTVLVNILIPISLILLSAMTSARGIGFRLIFMLYPMVLILVALLMVRLIKFLPRHYLFLIVALPVYYIYLLTSHFPFYLSYSNELIINQQESYRYLSEANLDWGQGLKELKNYVESNNINNLATIYFYDALPEYYGFKSYYPKIGIADSNWINRNIKPKHHWLAISAEYANLSGFNKFDYRINGQKPYKIIASSILVYRL